ncbi:sulfite exporter TauE/SafE family protein [Parvularcula sp. LCG005]|uniref:sulfite exporter TauE/SafE family protein n=1 Tax=Parvularcula sp. LCG005 TaxID=3078805 RepID=UPI0029435E3F|nr:sulfite exporter TauE/SafE family protein [Parvularcula sp. LCG005]WOI52331.1 sulfite exporter TauE/SafE family protein [Parvularcula sp. LCG005]
MDSLFFVFVLIGFFAQLVDGALGMAYGVTSTTALVAVGLPPAVASANVHLAEIFTTAASGTSHAIARNIDWRLFRRLAFFGALGGAIGAWGISTVDLHLARPAIAAYLFVMGLVVLRKAILPPAPPAQINKVGLLGLVGGFCDATGGGGWGPIVTTNLIARGGAPAKMIGTVNLAEFVVTVTTSGAFFLALGANFGVAAAGLLVGGLVAAPLAAFLARKAPRRGMMAGVGILICLVSAYTIWTFFQSL